MTAAVVASQNPSLLRGLILADPTFLSAKVQREIRDSDAPDQHRRILDMSFDEIVADARAKHPVRSPELIELITRARLQTSMSAFDVLTPPNPDYMQLASSIDVPTLLIIGENGLVSPTVAGELQLVNPKFKVEKIPNAGHGVHYDQPERFAIVVMSFLRSIG
jgi:pimeloyl-ACP methyl ester carboxylesterase